MLYKFNHMYFFDSDSQKRWKRPRKGCIVLLEEYYRLRLCKCCINPALYLSGGFKLNKYIQGIQQKNIFFRLNLNRQLNILILKHLHLKQLYNELYKFLCYVGVLIYKKTMGWATTSLSPVMRKHTRNRELR